jgi:Rrf2 family transcriptional regulator, cysteine metabolism repressor
VKLSVKVEYACRVLAQLARVYGQQELSHIEELAAIEKVPANYLAQILTELRNGGLIISRRGKLGGYALARRPEEVTLFDILKVVDPEMLDFPSSREGFSGPRVSEIWREVQQATVDKTLEFTLDQFVEEQGEGMYYI